jgi:hypothetical protein
MISNYEIDYKSHGDLSSQLVNESTKSSHELEEQEPLKGETSETI